MATSVPGSSHSRLFFVRERSSHWGVGKTGTGTGTWDRDIEGKTGTGTGTWDRDIEGKTGTGTWDWDTGLGH